VPYLIFEVFGFNAAVVAASFCTVVGIALLIAGHRHKDEGTRRGVMATIGFYTLVGLLVGASTGAITGIALVLKQKFRPEVTTETKDRAKIPAAEDKDHTPAETGSGTSNDTGVGAPTNTGATARVAPLPPLKKVDKFATVVPFDASNKNMPVPMNINYNDPKARFYGDLLGLAGRPAKQQDGTAWPVERNFNSPDAAGVFIGRLLQFYVFRSIDELQRDSEGIQWTAEQGSKPIVRVGIVPPDSTPYPTKVLLAELSKSEFLRAGDRMLWERSRPVSLPKHTKLSLIEHPSSPTTGVAQYIVRLERPGYLSLDFKVTQTLGPITVGGVSGASVPKGFQPTPGGAPIVGYPFIVTMTYEIHRIKDGEFQTEDYAKWADALFAGLKQKMAYD
jgi:hypothetical protein